MSENKERTNALLELLGKVRGNKTIDGLKAAAERLDKAGVQRKSIDPTALATKIVTAAKDAGEDANLIDVVREELEAALAVDVSAGEPAAEAEEEIEEEEGEEPTGDDPLKTIVKAFADQGDTIRQDVGQIAKAQLAQVDQMGDVAKVLTALDERMKAIEASLDGRPRIASKADETAIDNDGTDAFKELLQRLETGAEGPLTFLGQPVKEKPE